MLEGQLEAERARGCPVLHAAGNGDKELNKYLTPYFLPADTLRIRFSGNLAYFIRLLPFIMRILHYCIEEFSKYIK